MTLKMHYFSYKSSKIAKRLGALISTVLSCVKIYVCSLLKKKDRNKGSGSRTICDSV